MNIKTVLKNNPYLCSLIGILIASACIIPVGGFKESLALFGILTLVWVLVSILVIHAE